MINFLHAEAIIKQARRIPRFYLVLLVLVSIVIISAGYIFYSLLRDKAEEDIKNELTSILKIKNTQIINWREERVSEAKYYFNNDIFLKQAEKFVKNPDASNTEIMRTWISTMQENHYHSIIISDRNGKELFVSGKRDAPPLSKEEIDSGFQLKRYRMDDMAMDQQTGFIHLNIYVPLTNIKERDKPPFALMVLIIDPRDDLYPLIKTWPGKSESAEAILFREKGDSVLYISDLKYRSNSAFRYKLPLSREGLPAAEVVKGHRGIFEGTDYKGQKVISSGDIITGTNWYIITKLNKDEIDKSIYLYSALTLIIIVALLLAAAALIALLTWRRESAVFRKLYKAEQEKLAIKEHYEHLVKQANDIILLMDYSGNIIDANERAAEVYGYSHNDLLSMNIIQLRVSENLDLVKNLGEYSSEEGVIYESAHRKKNGEIIFIEASSRIIQVNEVKYIQNIIRDITDRKLNEIKLRKLNRLYLYLTKVNEIIIKEADRLSLYKKFCDVTVETGTFTSAAVALINSENRSMSIAASSGPGKTLNALLKNSHLRPFADNIFMSGSYLMSNDIEHDREIAAWHEKALQEGFRSYAVFPLRQGSKLIGIILFFSGEVNFFDQQEISLLTEVSNNLSYAVNSIAREEERRTAEQAVRQSELNLKTLAANIPDTNTFLFNRKLEIISAEGKDPEFSRHQLLNIKGSDISLLFKSDMIPREKFLQVFNGERSEFELQSEGAIYSIRIYPVKSDGGLIDAGIMVVQNITKRKASEETLRNAENRLRAMFNLTNVYMNIMELQQNEIYFVISNHKMTSLFSSKFEDVTAKSIREVLGEERHNYWIDIYRNVLKYNRPVTIEFPINTAEKNIWLLVEINLIEERDNGSAYFSVVGFDITDRKNVEEELKRSEERFRSFFESNIIGILFGDIYGSIKYANDRFLNIVGYTRQDLDEGRISWKEITPPEYHHLDYEKIEEAKIRGECEPYYKEYIRKDGKLVKVLVGFVLLGENREESIAFIVDSSLPNSGNPDTLNYKSAGL